MSEKPILPPTPLARQYVRLILGFGIGVGLGLAPFLGEWKIPGFRALLSLYPNTLRDVLVATGAFLMGVIAVVVQFYARERLVRAHIRRIFRRTVAVVALALAFLVILWSEFVLRVETSGEPASFIVAGARETDCPCPPGMQDSECVQRLGANRLSRCWNERVERRISLAFFASYFLLTGGFGVLIGVLLLQAKQQEASRAARRRRRAGRRPPPAEAETED